MPIDRGKYLRTGTTTGPFDLIMDLSTGFSEDSQRHEHENDHG